MTTALCWQPIYLSLEERIRSGDKIILMMVAFSKLDALKRLCIAQGGGSGVKVICRWRPSDLVVGASDLEVFEYLRDAGSHLYINRDIHMKLYVFDSNMALNTSGNLTLSGLGYGDRVNIEVGSFVPLGARDWGKVFSILNTSRQVDDQLYDRFKSLVKAGSPSLSQLDELDILPPPKKFSIGSLPASESPRKLYLFYTGQSGSGFTPEEIRRAAHDLSIFQVPPGLQGEDFDKLLDESFQGSPFISEFLGYLKANRSLRFGAVNNWIHDKCEDVPLPYRWEVKENTRILYTWLAYYVPGVTWNRPNYSQVIYWQAAGN